MKLSQAMREGAKLHAQIFGTMFERRDGQITKSCALGAAFEHVFGDRAINMMLSDLERELDVLMDAKCNNPVTGENDELNVIVLFLNDEQHWTREAIADWLESIGY